MILTTSLQIEGMHCGSCVGRVEKALRAVPGVQAVGVNLMTGAATVEGAADSVLLVRAVEGAGYKGRVLADMSAATVREVQKQGEVAERGERRRLILGLLFGVPAVATEMMMHHQKFMALHFYADFHDGYNIFVAILATAVMGITGWPFFVRGTRAAIRLSPNMDTLVALGAGVAYIASLISLVLWFRGESHLHGGAGFSMPSISEFHAAVAIIVLVTLGKYLEARAKKRASAAVANLAQQSSPTAMRVLADGSVETVAAEQIQIGDRVQLLAHQQAAVDGEVVEGGGALDLSIVTGESVPVEIGIGAAVAGGATLADGRIVMRATSTAGTSTVARILELVNGALSSKTGVQKLADRVAGIFVPIVLGLGLLNFALWMGTGHRWEIALLTTIATIVIACPCAMGLATPTAVTVALGRAAKMGILFTKASALESGRGIGTVLFDKTGTLTTGVLRVTNVVSMEDPPKLSKELIEIAASVEQFSDHPLAKAIVANAAERGLTLRKPATFNSVPGGGVRATFEDGREYAVGSAEFMTSLGVSVEGKEGEESRVFIADMRAKSVIARIALLDTLRLDAWETLQRIKRTGVHVGVVSGDSEVAVRGVLKGMPVDFVRAGVKPEEKAAVVEDLKLQNAKLKNKELKSRDFRKRGRGVAFVGDGVNDAPALAAADLGIAMATGADMAKSAGEVLLMSNRLTAIPSTLELSRRTLGIIRQNLFWAFAYNVAAIPLAMLNHLSPGVAAGAMMFSSLTVVLNALRLYRVKL